MNGLSLCTGYGGFELGLGAVFCGLRTVGYVEREARAAATIVARMADEGLDKAPVWDDVATFDGRPWRGSVDIIAAGIPCQPWSSAGKRRGSADERWLWPHVLRIATECRPALVAIENVPGLDVGGVRGSLREAGYESEAGLLSAGQVGAPMGRPNVITSGRDRVWVLAYARRDGRQILRQALDDDGGNASGQFADRCAEGVVRGEHRWPPRPRDVEGWRRWLIEGHPEPGFCREADGPTDGMDLSRADRIALLGGGGVPLQAAVAMRTLAHRILADG